VEHYLDMLFGDEEGFVAVAAKGEGWEESQFSWPAGRGRLLRWVERHIDTDNIFICPALRSEKRRVKGDGVSLDWLWADIDWEKVNDKPAVMAAIKQLQPALVYSGTGKNLHVYLHLSREVTIEEHYRLNQGLRDLLEADAKHPDNSLLRLPGTYNRKGKPVEVIWRRMASMVWAPEDLLEIPAIRDTRIVHEKAVGDGTYEKVSLEGLPGYARRVGKMESDEAIDRFGSRHGAVYQVTLKLIKLGLSRDQIHTALEEFPPGLEKQEDEQGYDLHRDIDRCIARHPTLEPVPEELAEAPGIVEISDEEYEQEKAAEEEDDLDQAARKWVWRQRVEERGRQMLAHAAFLPPPDEATVLFSERLEEEPEDVEYLVEGLASVGDNVSITGQFKSGKTLFVCNLVRSLAAHTPFLDRFKVDQLGAGTVGFWSLEMTQAVLENRYMRPQGMTEDQASNLIIWHGRGYGIPLLSGTGRQWAIDWLKRELVEVWVIDSFARICAMSGVEANDNDQVLRLLKTLDEIKKASGVSEMFLIAHTGRGLEAGNRARGATVFDDWADARWILTRDDSIRFLQVEGRDVELEKTSLGFDAETKHLTLGVDPAAALRKGSVQTVVDIVRENPGIGKTALTIKVRESRMRGYSQNQAIAALIDEAADLGLVRCDPVPGARGRKMSYTVVAEADILELDFSQVKERQGSGRGRGRTRR